MLIDASTSRRCSPGAYLLERENSERRVDEADLCSPWAHAGAWRLNGAAVRELQFDSSGQSVAASLCSTTAGELSRTLAYEGQSVPFAWQADSETVCVNLGRVQIRGQVHLDGDAVHVFYSGKHHVLQWIDTLAHAGDAESEGGKLTAPMPGKVVTILVETGSKVVRGAPLLVMEAMKMEHTITAPHDGTIGELLYSVGDQVTEGAQLLSLLGDETGDSGEPKKHAA